MNKKFKKVLLSLLLFISLLITSKVVADSLSTGNTEGKITVNKVATKDIGIEGNETYGRKSNVTLTISGNSYTTTSSLDVVLVIDRSGSMNDKASKNDNKTKMQATKTSAITLATSLLSNNTPGKNVVNMGIVTFGSNVIETAGNNIGAVRLTSQSLSSNTSDITSMINAIPDSVGTKGDTLGSQGTNIQSGLERAKQLLANSTAANKVVILLTDGKPTYFNYEGNRYGDGGDDSRTCVEWGIMSCNKYMKPSTAAKNEAEAIETAGSVIYTVGFGLGNDTTTTSFLQDVATGNDRAFLANNETELLENFNNIVKSIAKIANNVVVEDVVPEGFEVAEEALKNTYGDNVSLTKNEDGTTTITWNVGDLTSLSDKTLTYQVTAKDEYYGSMYTNKYAILTGTAEEGNPAYPNGNIEEVFPLPVVAIPVVTQNDTYTAKLGEVLNINTNNGILTNDSDTMVEEGNGQVLRNEIIIKSTTCGDITDIQVNEDGSFSYTPNSTCYKDNNEVVFEYEVKSTVMINEEEYIVISNTSNITIDLTKDDSNIENPIVNKTSNNNTTTVIDGPFNYTITYSGIINNHIGTTNVTIIDKLPYELDLTKENNLDGGVYDATNKTITWIIEIKDVDSYQNQNNNIDINKNISIFYKEVPTDIDTIVNNVSVSTDIDNKTVEDTEEIEVVRSNLLVEYVDNKGNKLLTDISKQGLIGTNYETSANNTINVDNNEYQLVATKVNGEEIEKTNSYNGTFTETNTTVTYVYYLITGNIDEEQTIFTKDGTDKITSSADSFEYEIFYSTKIDNYIGNAKVTIIDKLPLEIDTTKEYNLDGGTYNATNKTITWVIDITDIDTYKNGEYEVKVSKNIEVVFKGIDATERNIINEVSAKIETSKTTDEKETEKETELAINGNVIAHYIDVNNNKLLDDITTSGLVGNEYVTSAKNIDGYKLVETKGNSTGNYIDGTIEVTYIYYKVEGTILDDVITKTGTTEITEVNANFNYKIKYEAVIKDYIGNALVTIVDTLPLEIDTTKEYNLDGGIYDATNKTITWEIDINDIDTNKDGDKIITITKNINLSYKDLDPKSREITNTITGNIKTNVTEENTEPSDHTTSVKVSGNVIANYVDTNNEVLAPTSELTGLVGDSYTTIAKDIEGYKLVEIKGNSTGNYIDGTIEVTYVYYKVDGTIQENEIIKTGTEEITKVDSKVNYTISYNTIVKDYIGNATVTIVDTLPLEIDTTKEYNLDGGIYDAANKTITWIIDINDIDTNKDGEKVITITKNISLSYKDLDPTTRKITNTVVGKITTEVGETTTEPDSKETLVNISGKVISHYIDTNNNTISEDTTIIGIVGNEYVTSAKDITNYQLVSVEGNTTGKYIDGTIEVTYIYYKETGEIVGDVITKTGTEEITTTNSKVDYNINYEAVIKNYIGNAKVTIVDTLPLEIDTTKEYNLDGGIYDATNKTITWIIDITDIDTNKDGDYLVKVTKNISLSYKDLDPTTRVLTNTVTGNIKTDIKEVNTTPDNHDTAVSIKGNVIAHYVDTNNNVISENIILTDLVGNEYITSAKDIEGYKLVEIEGQETGKYIDGTIEATYVYYQITGKITDTTLTKDGNEEITTSKDIINYNISYETNINNYIGNAQVTIIDYLPYKLDLTLSDLDGGIYDEENNTITWNIDIVDIDTYTNGIYNLSINKNISLSYKDIDLTSTVITNKVEAIIKTDVSEDKNDDEFDTEVNVKGKVIINYVDEFGNTLAESITLTDKVGTDYSTTAKDIENYILLNVLGEEEGLFTEEDIIITYIYKEIGKGGDVEEMPPQTGVNETNTLYSIIASLMLMLFTILKKLI